MNYLRAAMTVLLGLLLAGTAMAGDTVYYYSSDTVHSEVVITDASRNVVERTNYAPYGQVLNRALRDGPAYTGHEEDPETLLVYMQQRYFDPQSGQFLSSDPAAVTDNGGSFNRYAYANDNPYRYLDPDGKETTGEFINGEAQNAADRGDHFDTFLWAFTGVAWDVFGAESVSQVVDKGSEASTSDKVMAALTVVSLGKGEGVTELAENAGKVAKGVAADAKFAQATFSKMFSKGGTFAGKSVQDVAGALRSGAMKASDVPINYIVRDGQTIILNTRSAQALEGAGIPRSQWSGVNQTGNKLFENLLDGQLGRNPGGPFDTVRPSGGP